MKRILALVFAVLIPIPAFAQPAAPKDIFEVIPRDASAAIVLRSIGDFKTKGNQLLKEVELQYEMTPEKLVGLALTMLNIPAGVDEKAPVALSILQSKDGGQASLEDIILLVPIADRAKILSGFALDREPKDNEIATINNGGGIGVAAIVVRGKYLGLAASKAGLQRLTNESLKVSDSEKKQFGDADILLYLGKRAWPFVFGTFLDQLGGYFANRKDEEERKVGKKLVQGLRATEHSFSSLRFENGVRFRGNMVLDVKNEKAAAELLDMLKAGTNRSNLKRLPEGKAIAGLGWAGDGSKNGIVTKLLFDDFLEGPLPGIFNSLPVFAHTDYPTLAGVAHEVWQRLKAARVGLYQNENEKELGLFSAVAILDTTDGPAFIKEIRTLSRIADLKKEDLDLPDIQKLLNLDKLVRDLDDPVFRNRQAAATRILLVGEPALPALNRAIAKPLSLEQKRRAEDLKKDIDVIAADRRKEVLLGKDVLRTIRPTFAVAADIEKRGGVSVDVLKMTFNTKDKAFIKRVEELLGPNWDKVRMAAVGDQVVVLLGSDAALFDKTVANLKTGKAGLADAKVLNGFDKRADKDRTAEMHGSAQAFLGLLYSHWKLSPKLFRDSAELTSFAISFEPDRLQVDLWVPSRELRVMLHAVLPKAQ